MSRVVMEKPRGMSDSLRVTLRFLGFALGILIGWQTGALLALADDSQDTRSLLVLTAFCIGAIGYVIGPHVSWAIFRNLKALTRSASTLDIVALGVGILFGGLVSASLAIPLGQLPEPLGTTLPFIAAVIVCALSVAVVLLRKRDLIQPWLKVHVPAPAASPSATAGSPQTPERPAMLLDTSVIIDGRIADLMRTGFLDARLQVPRFVLEELQRIADSDDPMRRARGRRGLDSLSRLQRDAPADVEVIDVSLDPREARDVDAKLVRLAKERDARIMTNDHNLDRVAQLQGVQVLNLHELTGALRPPVQPGEELSLKLVQAGREAGQGVGFLDDGTMVVVDDGKSLVGQQARVTVTRLLQTGAGRMIFAVPKHAGV